MDTSKAVLVRHLRSQREALLWKLEGLTEEQLRRPRTVTGTSLLGLVKHCAIVELGYFTSVFGRASPVDLEAVVGQDAPPDLDMYATAEESPEAILDLHALAAQTADATIAELDLDAAGRVPWWPEKRREVTLAQIIVHVTVDLARHAGHADILRERFDGAVGLRRENPNMADGSEGWRADHVLMLHGLADSALDPGALPGR